MNTISSNSLFNKEQVPRSKSPLLNYSKDLFIESTASKLIEKPDSKVVIKSEDKTIPVPISKNISPVRISTMGLKISEQIGDSPSSFNIFTNQTKTVYTQIPQSPQSLQSFGIFFYLFSKCYWNI